MPDEPAVPAGDVASVGEAIERMRQIEAVLPPDDGVACFNRMYLDVTVQVGAALSNAAFADPAFMTTLDVVFANLYLDALSAAGAGEQVPAAWAPLFAARSDPRIHPIQFALAGMNAHINNDLPIAVVRTCEQLATEPDAGSHRADYQKVDVLLDAAEQSVRQSFEAGDALRLDESVQPVLDVVGNWTVNEARDLAWDTALALWRCRAVGLAEDVLTGVLGRAVATAGRCLLVPVRPAPPAPAGG